MARWRHPWIDEAGEGNGGDDDGNDLGNDDDGRGNEDNALFGCDDNFEDFWRPGSGFELTETSMVPHAL